MQNIVDESKKEANSIRANLWGDNKFPVDPVLISKKIGILVVEDELPTGVSGALVKKEQEEPFILINRWDTAGRKRYVCAYQLGHFLYRLERFDDLREVGNTGVHQSLKDKVDEESEQYAYNFAETLLMPEREVRLTYDQYERNMAVTAEFFGVSRKAIKKRLQDIG